MCVSSYYDFFLEDYSLTWFIDIYSWFFHCFCTINCQSPSAGFIRCFWFSCFGLRPHLIKRKKADSAPPRHWWGLCKLTMRAPSSTHGSTPGARASARSIQTPLMCQLSFSSKTMLCRRLSAPSAKSNIFTEEISDISNS